ncbi:MAG: hypothetical protein ACTHOD_01575 [Motilibacteraceae bacterium]
MAKEMERTCKRDGTVWYVPLKDAKPVTWADRQILGGAKMRSAGESMTLFGKPSAAGGARATALQLEHNRRNDAQRCPKCGSTSFREKKVRV